MKHYNLLVLIALSLICISCNDYLSNEDLNLYGESFGEWDESVSDIPEWIFEIGAPYDYLNKEDKDFIYSIIRVENNHFIYLRDVYIFNRNGQHFLALVDSLEDTSPIIENNELTRFYTTDGRRILNEKILLGAYKKSKRIIASNRLEYGDNLKKRDPYYSNYVWNGKDYKNDLDTILTTLVNYAIEHEQIISFIQFDIIDNNEPIYVEYRAAKPGDYYKFQYYTYDSVQGLNPLEFPELSMLIYISHKYGNMIPVKVCSIGPAIIGSFNMHYTNLSF